MPEQKNKVLKHSMYITVSPITADGILRIMYPMIPNEGEYKSVITLKLPEGEYILTFINPADISVISTSKIKSTGENMTIECPEYKLDIAFRIIRI